MNRSATEPLVEHLFRHESGRILAALTRLLGVGRIDLAEDAMQDALVAALRHWPYRGVPENPGGWLMQAARNRALDLLRREATVRGKSGMIGGGVEQAASPAEAAEELDSELRDDQLRMIFTCCHPALSRAARVALTLKALCGFGVAEIARAFLAEESTIARRLTRAKRTLRNAPVPFEVPDAAELPARLDSVLDVLYLLFNEGYSAHMGEDLVRHDLCAEAIRLTTLVASHPAGDPPKVHALLALMYLQAARLPARTDAGGDLLLLAEQDRTLWDRRMIALGMRELGRAAAGADLTEYHLQAGIAACHALALSYEATDWRRILWEYDALVALTPSPIAALNRAVAVAMVHGPRAGLDELERVRSRPGMAGYHLLHATLGEIRARMGDGARAVEAYRRAASLTANAAERRFLERRVAECGQVARWDAGEIGVRPPEGTNRG